MSMNRTWAISSWISFLTSAGISVLQRTTRHYYARYFQSTSWIDRCPLGSARVSRANANPARTFGIAPKRTFSSIRTRNKVRDRESALASKRDACAPQKSPLESREITSMARLHEYQGKAILAANGFKIPRGRAASTADEAMAAAKELGGEVVIKIQAWTTGRAGIGGVAFAKKPEEVRAHTKRMLAMKPGRRPDSQRKMRSS